MPPLHRASLRAALAFVALCGAGCNRGVSAVGATAPNVPDSIKPPPSETVATKAAARGVQIYECQAAPTDSTGYAWKLVAPDAELMDQDGKLVGKHYAGPTWEAADGSKVVGEMKQRVDAPDGQGIPWLLLKAKSTEGAGAFAKVTSIQRINTVGGKAPANGCGAGQVGTRASIPYQATYYFYSGHT